MCGIAGILDLKDRAPVEPRRLEDMCRALAHRGPDHQGTYLRGFLGLGHRRLAIIDTSSLGNQPMTGEDGRVVVCFNGTIYNFRELRGELQDLGHLFVSRCDTEVLVHGWEEWEEGLVERLNGHFAFVVWDARRDKLHLVRDRFGTKPLYYANLGGLWLFASEIKAILAHPAYGAGVNYDALCEYFTFQNIFRYHTLFKDVYLVPQSNIMTIDLDDGRASYRSYWDFDFSHPDRFMTEREATEEVQRLLIQAVQRQLVADVPVGAYLSGGIDSGSIVGIASKHLDHLFTFTCGWHLDGVEGVEQNFDERLRAERMAHLYQTEHYEQVVSHSDAAASVPAVVRHLEDLRLGMSYGNYYAARLASKFVKVCLGGAGGDELFGGYPWRYYRVAQSLSREAFVDAYYDYWQRLVPDEEHPSFFTPQAWARVGDRDMKQVFTKVFNFDPDLSFDTPEDHVANSLYFEAKTFLHSLLIVGDKLSMAHGLEERLPFLDNDLVAFAQIIPARLKLKRLRQSRRADENDLNKMRERYQEYDDGKNVLRQAMARFMPGELKNGPKQGFSSPDESWYRGPNLEMVKRALLGKKALIRDFVNPAYVERTVDEHLNQRVNRRLRIWSLLCFESWLRTFIQGNKVVAISPHREVRGVWPSGQPWGRAGAAS